MRPCLLPIPPHLLSSSTLGTWRRWPALRRASARPAGTACCWEATTWRVRPRAAAGPPATGLGGLLDQRQRGGTDRHPGLHLLRRAGRSNSLASTHRSGCFVSAAHRRRFSPRPLPPNPTTTTPHTHSNPGCSLVCCCRRGPGQVHRVWLHLCRPGGSPAGQVCRQDCLSTRLTTRFCALQPLCKLPACLPMDAWRTNPSFLFDFVFVRLTLLPCPFSAQIHSKHMRLQPPASHLQPAHTTTV